MKLNTILPQIKEGIEFMFASEETAKRMANDSNLEEILNDWISEEEEIVAHKISAVSNAILIVTNTQDEGYYLYRFFPTYETWQVSVDVQEKSLPDLLNFLLSYR